MLRMQHASDPSTTMSVCAQSITRAYTGCVKDARGTLGTAFARLPRAELVGLSGRMNGTNNAQWKFQFLAALFFADQLKEMGVLEREMALLKQTMTDVCELLLCMGTPD